MYRIIVMLLIVAHHYVVNSGLFEVLENDSLNASSIGMLLFGAWGKTGINCFILITGYFMCRSQITAKKFAKLVVQIIFYNIILFLIFAYCGLIDFTLRGFIQTFNIIPTIDSGFTSSFIVFYLLIPFLNKFLAVLDKRMHQILLVLLITVYSLFSISPSFSISFNYVTWFSILYLIAAYIRLYEPCKQFSAKHWGALTLITFGCASLSVVVMTTGWYKGYIGKFNPYFFVADSNKFLALAVAVTSFMFFKNLKITYSKTINILGAATFGVLLIHANSDTMRNWLWRSTVDCVGHYNLPFGQQLAYASACVLSIFAICALIDWLRSSFLEKRMLNAVKTVGNRLMRITPVSFVIR